MSEIAPKRTALLANIAAHKSCAVAFSGGVDSAVVAKAAYVGRFRGEPAK